MTIAMYLQQYSHISNLNIFAFYKDFNSKKIGVFAVTLN
jgi:hypothetical protein